MIPTLSYLSLVILVALASWILWVRLRGALGYWIRVVPRPEHWALGVTVEANHEKRLPEVVGLARTLELPTRVVMRQWDRTTDRSFVGLLLDRKPDQEIPAGFEIVHLPPTKVLRISGRSRDENITLLDAAKARARTEMFDVDFAVTQRFSGQSFSCHEWSVETPPDETPVAEPLAERVLRIREVVLIPVFLGLFSLALLGTGNWGLFALGLVAVIFLSGACKFVFVHQREDESQEEHLQNY